jgi:hypothetical protein
MDAEFKGITNEYRKSDEYKEWVGSIQRDYPNLPLYLIEMAIILHKNEPDYYLLPPLMRGRSLDLPSLPIDIPQSTVNVYNDASEIPPNGDGELIILNTIKEEE